MGRIHRLGDNVNTDLMIAGKYKHATMSLNELAEHFLEGVRPSFASEIQPGDFLVAGRNFGCGSSREQAPRIAQNLGIRAVVAKSFARIFLRNAINIGLLALECDTDELREGDEVEWCPDRWVLREVHRGKEWRPRPVLPEVREIIDAGGLLLYVRQHGGL